MPNYCQNSLEIKGKDSDVSKFTRECISLNILNYSYTNDVIEEKYLDFNKIVPEPKDIGDNWYDWRLANWGTKWGSCDTYFFKVERLDSEDNLKLTITFSTAWCPPDKIYDALIEKYKDTSLEFRVEYYEGGVGFAGHMEFTQGEITDNYYVQYYNDKDKAIEYYAYIIKHGHESLEYISDCIYEKLESEDVEESIINKTIEEFDIYCDSGEIEKAAEMYVNIELELTEEVI